MAQERATPLSARIIFPLLVFALAALIYGLVGFDGNLGRDEGIYMYAGQRMADGVPPYVSIFDKLAPIGPMLVGIGGMLSRVLQWDDIFTVRLLFFILGCLAVVVVFLLSQHLFGSRKAGIFSALAFLGFAPFADSAASGPQIKTAMVLFAALNLLLTSESKWFWAGQFGSLAALTWQPAVIFPAVTLFLAMTKVASERLPAVIRTLAGVGLPLAIIVIYFQYHGALYQLWEGAVLFNLTYLQRDPSRFLQFLSPLSEIGGGYRPRFLPIMVGFFMMGYLYLWRRSQHRSWRETLTQDIFSPIFLTFPAPIFWSLLDFQAAPDFFVFLPYLALGLGQFLDLALRRTPSGLGWVLVAGAGLVLIFIAWFPALLSRGDSFRLEDHRKAALEVERRYGQDVRLVSIGLPQVLVLLHKVNPSRYIFIGQGIDLLIQDTYPGGFEGWVQEVERDNPDIIAMGPDLPIRILGPMEWLEVDYHQEEIGPWKLWVSNTLGGD